MNRRQAKKILKRKYGLYVPRGVPPRVVLRMYNDLGGATQFWGELNITNLCKSLSEFVTETVNKLHDVLEEIDYCEEEQDEKY